MVRAENLSAYMQGSQAVDETGAPKRLYHATSADFSIFDPKKAARNSGHPASRLGHFLAATPEAADLFSRKPDKFSQGTGEYKPGANIMPVHAAIKNPHVMTWKEFAGALASLNSMPDKKANKEVDAFRQQLVDAGHDGILIKGGWKPGQFLGSPEFLSDNWVAFDPTQIKSATGNQGTFDPSNPDITKKRGGTVETKSVDVDHPNFRSWFGNSVAHDDGQPRRYFTGTSKDVDFPDFKVSRHGAWFTTDPKEASSYAEQNDSQGYKFDGMKVRQTNTASRVIPAYLRAENPYTGNKPEHIFQSENYKKAQSDWFDTLRSQGYDSWIPESQGGNLAVILGHPGQIKSAVSNTGDFDPDQKRIDRADGGDVEGKGITVYQGRSKKGAKQFFNPNGHAWGTTLPETAEQFAGKSDSHYSRATPPRTETKYNGEVHKLRFNITNPMHTDIRETLWNPDREAAKISEAKGKGHDGLAIYHSPEKTDYVAFHPDQVEHVESYTPEPIIAKADGGEVEDYRGQHEAPGPGYGMPLHDTTDVYPKDFYGPNGFDYYANFGGGYDRKAYNTAVRLKGDPEAHVWIHRAVPTAVYKAAMKTDAPLAQLIKKGDWVTPTKEYAQDHGEGALNGDYKIASKRVKAKEVFTDGNSIHEWGYHPSLEKADGGALTDDEGIIAYHGTPHDFEQFDASKIGTGEGAQAYGHGLYFAQNEDVAKGYRDDLSKSSNEGAARRLKRAEGDIDAAITQAQERAQTYRANGAPHYAGAVEDDLRALEHYKKTGDWSAGRMYEVHIKAHPDHFLDWDEVLEDQNPHVKAALQRVADHDEAEKGYTDLHDHLADPDAYTGGAFYQNLADRGRAKEASEILSQMGVKGIRYKDAGSRIGNAKPSYNYVVFDHDHVRVRRKYKQGGAV